MLDVSLLSYAVLFKGKKQPQFSERYGRVLSLLVPIGRVATVDDVIELLWPDPDHESDSSYRSVYRHVQLINEKLQPLGYRIRWDGARRCQILTESRRVVAPQARWRSAAATRAAREADEAHRQHAA